MNNNTDSDRNGYFSSPEMQKNETNKRSIYIGIGVIVVGIILFIYIFSGKSHTSRQSDNILAPEDESDVIFDEGWINEGQIINDESPDKQLNEWNSISIDNIPSVKMSIDRIADNKSSVDGAFLEQFDGVITFEGQEDVYRIKPQINGKYRFEFSNLRDEIYHGMYLYDSANEEIAGFSTYGNGDGITEFLKGGQSYVLKVVQDKDLGSYTLNIGHQKPTVIITGLTQISDSVQITNQQNEYIYVPEIDGVYTFELSDMSNNTYYNLYVVDSNREILYSSEWNSTVATVTLDAGKEYGVIVQQDSNFGSYKLNIGSQKPIVDISEYNVISDSTQYTNQENRYIFTPKRDGLYRFEFNNVPNNIEHSICIYNSHYEMLDGEYDRNYGFGNGEGVSINLNANETYYVVVVQYANAGSYDLLIGTQKETVDISSLISVNDSIQYTAQENKYMYIPDKDGEFRFEMSNVAVDVEMSMFVYNSYWEELGRSVGTGNGGGINISLNSGSTYYVVVKQYRNLGVYNLSIS